MKIKINRALDKRKNDFSCAVDLLFFPHCAILVSIHAGRRRGIYWNVEVSVMKWSSKIIYQFLYSPSASSKLCLISAAMIVGCIFFPVVFRLLLIPLIILFAVTLFLVVLRIFYE